MTKRTALKLTERIEILDLSVKAYSVLQKAGIVTVGQIYTYHLATGIEKLSKMTEDIRYEIDECLLLNDLPTTHDIEQPDSDYELAVELVDNANKYARIKAAAGKETEHGNG